MSRLFWGRKELNFISRISAELIQHVVRQTCYYYAVLAEQTVTDDLYNEAITKVTADPVAVNALVYYENTTDQVTALPPDSKYALDVHFHTQELVDRNLAPKMGDFIQFGDIVFEVYSVSQPQLVFGQIEQKVMTKCTCGPARKGQFDPVRRPSPVAREDQNAPLYSTQPDPRSKRR